MPRSLRGRLGPLVLCCVSGGVLAAENLPALRVDPALLGQGVPRPVAHPPEATPGEPVAPAGSGLAVPTLPRREPERESIAEAPSAVEPPRRTAPAPKAEADLAATAPTPKPAAEEKLAAPAPPPAASLDVLPAEGDALPPLALRMTERLSPLTHGRDQPLPTFIAADRITGRTDDETRAEGAVEVRKGATIVNADQLTHWESTDEIEAEGSVRLQQDADVIAGPKLRLKLSENVGFFEQPKYSITRSARIESQVTTTPSAWQPAAPVASREMRVIAGEVVSDTSLLATGSGHADRLDFEGEGRYHLTNATYSTCRADDPDWYAQVADLRLDYDREVGEGRDAKVVFKNVPIFYSPWLDFALNNRRKSGFLPPTFGSSTTSGAELTVPYYWNIAPNMDATIAPRVMSRRGVQLNGEFRYLNYAYNGQARIEWLPGDNLQEGRRRSGYAVAHNQDFGNGLTGSLNLNGVSDDTYFRDLSTRLATISQSNLLRQGLLTYGAAWGSIQANVQRYQTLFDPALPAPDKPYDRTPQITLAAAKPDLYGSSVYLNGEFVDYSHPTKVLGKRLTLYPQFALPLQAPAYYLTPKIGYNITRYNLSRQDAGVPDQITRSVPVFSVDGGVAFERDTNWFGRGLTQTLEPRLYYLYVPTRRQDQIPNFDSNLADINFATLFAENIFTGGDRLVDANQMTAALTSRLIDPASGREFLRGAIGQRYYFKDQEVTLPGVPARSGRNPDVFAAVTGEVLPRTFFDTAVQYNPREGRTEKLLINGRYQPESTKVVNAGYRFYRDLLNQIDVSGQWPLGRGWYGVGRYNYSLKESSVIESVGGLEYDGGCWVGRFVVQRIATATNKATTAFFVQLELNGLARVGSNPLDILKRNIPGYGKINQPTADPAFAAD